MEASIRDAQLGTCLPQGVNEPDSASFDGEEFVLGFLPIHALLQDQPQLRMNLHGPELVSW